MEYFTAEERKDVKTERERLILNINCFLGRQSLPVLQFIFAMVRTEPPKGGGMA